VRRARVPAPGGPREFAEVLSAIASTPLERDRPLWQLWLVEGLEGDRLAYVTKLHHAAADGVASARILLDAFQDTPSPSGPRPEHPPDEPPPPARELLLGALRYWGELARRLPALLARTLRWLAIALRRALAGESRMAPPFAAPRTRFNRPITPHRWFANADLPLADLRRVKEILGGTLNDVYVAICAGAIRRYLEERGELPAEPLTASIPVSIRKPEEERSYGNRVGVWMVSLATHLADPVLRYRAISRAARDAREAHQAKDPELLADWQDYWWIYRAFYSLQRLVGRLLRRPVFHVILSNVRGPAAPIYSDGARVVALRSMGPILDDGGLNFTGWSYVDTMSVGIVACREHVPDLWALAEGVELSLRELREAAEKEQAQGRAGPPPAGT
jgi:WS/DGAT/MGAT family acyltransferase